MPARAEALADERLTLLSTCFHPALALEAQVALTLRFLAGTTTVEVAAAPELRGYHPLPAARADRTCLTRRLAAPHA